MGELGEMCHLCYGDEKSVRVHVQSKSICLCGSSICSYLCAAATKSMKCQHMAPVFTLFYTEAAFFILASVSFVMSIGAPKAVTCFGRNDLASSGEFAKHNLERVPCNEVTYGRRPFLFFREVVSEFGTMDGVGNVVQESRGDFPLLNGNRALLLWKVETVWIRFHVWIERGLCLDGKSVS
jgi:hypothetical protein